MILFYYFLKTFKGDFGKKVPLFHTFPNAVTSAHDLSSRPFVYLLFVVDFEW